MKTAGFLFFPLFFPACLGQTGKAGNKKSAFFPPSVSETGEAEKAGKPFSFIETSQYSVNGFAEKHHFDRTRPDCLFDQAEINLTSLRLMAPSGTKSRDWQRYRQKMIEPAKTATGLQFRDQYEKHLRLAEQQFSAPIRYCLNSGN